MLFTIPGSIHDGRREGRDGERKSEPHPPGAPPNFVARTRTDGRTEGRKDAGLSGFPMFRILPRAENVIPSEGSRHSNGSRGGRGASRGAGRRRWSPSPPPPRPPAPGSRGSAFLGSLFFRGSRFWTVAIGCHSAFPRPDAATMLALLRGVSAEKVAFSIGRHLCWWRLTLRLSLKRRTP